MLALFFFFCSACSPPLRWLSRKIGRPHVLRTIYTVVMETRTYSTDEDVVSPQDGEIWRSCQQ